MRKFALIAAAAVVVASSSAFAGSKNDGFVVKVKITGTCSVNAPDIDFGITEDVVGGTTAAVPVTVKCSNLLPYSLALDVPLISQMSGAKLTNTDKIAYGLAFPTLITGGIGAGMGAAVTADSHTLTATLTASSAPVADDYSQARVVSVIY